MSILPRPARSIPVLVCAVAFNVGLINKPAHAEDKDPMLSMNGQESPELLVYLA